MKIRYSVMILCAVTCIAFVFIFYPDNGNTQTSGRDLTVGDILANPSQYDQKNVTVVGRALIVRKKKDSSGKPWMLISFFDMKDDKKVINVFGPGHPNIGNGDIAKVTGIFKINSKRGRYTFKNEIASSSDRVILVAKPKH